MENLFPPIFRINSKQVKLNKDFFKDQIIFRNTIIGYDLKNYILKFLCNLGKDYTMLKELEVILIMGIILMPNFVNL